MKINNIVLSLAAVATLASAGTAWAQPADKTKVMVGRGQDGAGGAVVHTQHATITAIDQASRSVTLKTETGEVVTIHAGEAVQNFAQLKVGDVVTFRRSAAVLVGLRKVSDGIRQRTEWVDVQRNAPGARPGLTARHIVQAIANVIAIDAKAGTVDLRGVNEMRTVAVPDRGILTSLKVGDQVEVTIVDSDAISIRPGKG